MGKKLGKKSMSKISLILIFSLVFMVLFSVTIADDVWSAWLYSTTNNQVVSALGWAVYGSGAREYCQNISVNSEKLLVDVYAARLYIGGDLRARIRQINSPYNIVSGSTVDIPEPSSDGEWKNATVTFSGRLTGNYWFCAYSSSGDTGSFYYTIYRDNDDTKKGTLRYNGTGWETGFSDVMIRVKQKTGPYPDLIVSDITFDPSNPVPNQSIKAKVYVKNIGDAAAWLGSATVVFQAGGAWNSMLIGAWINPNQTVAYDFSFAPFKSPITGNFPTNATVDWSDGVLESNENNNFKTKNVWVDYQDLYVYQQDISFNKPMPLEYAIPEYRNPVVVSAVIHNNGGNASKANIEFWDGDPASGGTAIGTISGVVIPANSVRNVSINWTNRKPSGNHNIYVVAKNLTKDRDGTNNKASDTARVCGEMQVVDNFQCKDAELVLVYIPVNWDTSDFSGFDSYVSSQDSIIRNRYPLKNCLHLYKTIKLYSNCAVTVYRNSMVESTLIGIKNCVDSKQGNTNGYDYIVGLADTDDSAWLGYAWTSQPAVYIDGDSRWYAEVSAHEIGHKFGLKDEYCHEGSHCGANVQPNPLLHSYGCNESMMIFGGTYLNCTTIRDESCCWDNSTDYKVTCCGNRYNLSRLDSNYTNPARSIMTFAGAPGPANFEDFVYNNLAGKTKLDCQPGRGGYGGGAGGGIAGGVGAISGDWRFYDNGNVLLYGKLQLVNNSDNATNLPEMEGNYTILTVNETAAGLIGQQNFSVINEIWGEPDLTNGSAENLSTHVSFLDLNIRIPWTSDTKRLMLFNNYNGVVYFDDYVEFCNHNYICEDIPTLPTRENSFSCPSDCPTGGPDGYCDGFPDNKCDPDCGNADPDCMAKTNIVEGDSTFELPPGSYVIDATGYIDTRIEINLTENCTITIANASDPTITPGSIGRFVDFTTGCTFPAALGPLIIIYYNESSLTVDESQLRIYYWDGSQWVQLPGGVNTDENYVYGYITPPAATIYTAMGVVTNQSGVVTKVQIANAPPWIEAKWELPDDDLFKNGTQVLPIQNDVKIVKVCTVVCDDNGANDIVNITGNIYYPNYLWKGDEVYSRAEEECQVSLYDPDYFTKHEQGICDLYVSNISMQYYDPAGLYTVEIIATDKNETTGSTTNVFEYLSLIALELDTNLVDFGPTAPGNTVQIAGDNDFLTSEKPTIKNAGNVVIDLSPIDGTDLTGTSGTIPVSNLDTGFVANDYTIDIPQTFYDLNLTANGYNLENFELFVPLGTAQGSYTGTVTLTAVQSV